MLDPETLKVEKEMELEGNFNYYLIFLNTCTVYKHVHDVQMYSIVHRNAIRVAVAI